MPKIPEGMIQLRALPVGQDGAPVWNDEVEAATKRFGSVFLAPFMVEVSPGMVIGGYVARATFDTQVRSYEAKATLIVRKNDELRTTVVVTAPGTRDGWKPYSHEYKASLPKVHLENMVHTIRGLCEQSHAKELLSRDQSPVEARQTDAIADIEARLRNSLGATDELSEGPIWQGEATAACDRRSVNSTMEERPISDPFKDLQNSIARNAALISEPTDHALLRQAEESKGHISLKAVSDEYNRLILQKIERNRSRGFWSRLFG